MGSRGASSKKSGGGGSARPSEMSYKDVKFEEPELSPGKPTKAAEAEFNQSYRQARDIVESGAGEGNWRLQTFRDDSNPEFTKEYSTQTLKGIQQKINSEKSQINRAVEFDLITESQATTRMKALSAIQRTLNQTVKVQREVKKTK